MARVAVATSDGVVIDEHFGRAREFRVYDVNSSGGYRQIEVRSIGHVAWDEARVQSADTAVEQLSDVDAVLALQIGQSAAVTLSGRGIRCFAVRGEVDRVLSTYGRRHDLLNRQIPGVTGCGPCASRNCSQHARR